MATLMADKLPTPWFHILLALADHDLHGLAIMKEVFARTEGQLHLWPGALYGALNKLGRAGMVYEVPPPRGAATGGGRPRFYRITPLGRRACAAEAERLAKLVDAARAKRLIKRPNLT